MKKLLFLFAFMAIGLTLSAQTASLDRFIRKHKRAASGDKIDMTLPGFLVRFGVNFIDKDDLEGVDIKRIILKIEELRIVTLEKGVNIQHAEFQQLMTDIKAENFEELISVREKGGDRVNVMLRERKGFIQDILVFVNDHDGEFVLVNLAGKFTMDDINKMMANVNVKNTSTSK